MHVHTNTYIYAPPPPPSLSHTHTYAYIHTHTHTHTCTHTHTHTHTMIHTHAHIHHMHTHMHTHTHAHTHTQWHTHLHKRSCVPLQVLVIISSIDHPLHFLHVCHPVNLCVCKSTIPHSMFLSSTTSTVLVDYWSPMISTGPKKMSEPPIKGGGGERLGSRVVLVLPLVSSTSTVVHRWGLFSEPFL